MPLNWKGFSCIQFCNKTVVREEYFDEDHDHFETCLTKGIKFRDCKTTGPSCSKVDSLSYPLDRIIHYAVKK